MKEEEWLRQAKEGNEEAFHSLVSTHLKTVERFCFQLGVPAYQIDDVTQEVFIKVYRFMEVLDDESQTRRNAIIF